MSGTVPDLAAQLRTGLAGVLPQLGGLDVAERRQKLAGALIGPEAQLTPSALLSRISAPETDQAGDLWPKLLALDPKAGPGTAEHWRCITGAVWVKGAGGWRMYRARVCVEWSMQFCANPARVDRLRLEAAELVDAFPRTLPALAKLGYGEAEALLLTPIKDADGVEAWTDSLFNACVPLSRGNHQGYSPVCPVSTTIRGR